MAHGGRSQVSGICGQREVVKVKSLCDSKRKVNKFPKEKSSED